MPKISIIIPCYNYGQYVEAAIDSVLASTFLDFEILVINDGSTDQNTINVLNNLNKPKTRVIHQLNQGLAQTRNNGIKMAQGQYFLPLDADDTIEPTYLEKAYWFLESNPKLGFVYSYAQNFGDENHIWQTMEYNYYKLLWHNEITVCALVRKAAWQEAGGYNPNMTYGYEDWEFWINLGSHGWFGQLIPEPLFNHRKHGQTMTNTAFEKRKTLIDQIKANHSEVYNKKKLAQLKKTWKVNNLKQELIKLSIKIVDSRYFPVKLKTRIKIIYSESKRKRNYKKNINQQLIDFNLITEYSKLAENKIKILYIVPWLTVGGSEMVLFNLIEKLDKTLYQPIIVTNYKNENVWNKKFQAITPLIYHSPNLFSDENFVNFIIKLIKLYNIKVIYTSNSPLAYDSLEALKAYNPAIKIIDIIHNNAPEGFLKESALKDAYIDYHVAINSVIKETLINQYQVPDKKIALIYNGINTERFNPDKYNREASLKLFNLPSHNKIITYIGRFSSEKNPLGFISIAAVFKDNEQFVFVMAGDGKLMKQVKKLIKRHHLSDKVILLGEIEKIPELLKCTDVLINTSLIEGLSITILEAMAMGVPVIASNVGGTHELVIPEENGFIINNNNIKEYKNKINLLLNNSELLVKIKNNNINKVNSNFNLSNTARKYLDLIK